MKIPDIPDRYKPMYFAAIGSFGLYVTISVIFRGDLLRTFMLFVFTGNLFPFAFTVGFIWFAWGFSFVCMFHGLSMWIYRRRANKTSLIK